jgi:hypothetical protein
MTQQAHGDCGHCLGNAGCEGRRRGQTHSCGWQPASLRPAFLPGPAWPPYFSQAPRIPDGGGRAWEARTQLNLGLKTGDRPCLGLGTPVRAQPEPLLQVPNLSPAGGTGWPLTLRTRAPAGKKERSYHPSSQGVLGRGRQQMGSPACQAAQGGRAWLREGWGSGECGEDIYVL